MSMISDRLLVYILVLIITGVVMLGCGEPQPSSTSASQRKTDADQYDNSLIFRNLRDTIEEMDIRSISIVRIDDMIKRDETRERQIYQVILEELTKIMDLRVVEGDQEDISSFLSSKNIDPARGLSTDASINLAVFLNVDAIIYGTIESNDFDVHLKVYRAEDGGVLFSQTLSNVRIPIAKSSGRLEIPPELLESLGSSDK